MAVFGGVTAKAPEKMAASETVPYLTCWDSFVRRIKKKSEDQKSFSEDQKEIFRASKKIKQEEGRDEEERMDFRLWLLAFWLLAWPCLDATSSLVCGCTCKSCVVRVCRLISVQLFCSCGGCLSDWMPDACRWWIFYGWGRLWCFGITVVRLCSSADMLNRSDMPVFDIDSPVVRSAVRANKHPQGWSLHNHFLFPQRAFLKKPYAPTPLLPSMSVSPPDKPLSWVSSLADQRQPVLSNSVSLEPLTQGFLSDLGLVVLWRWKIVPPRIAGRRPQQAALVWIRSHVARSGLCTATSVLSAQQGLLSKSRCWW